MVGLIFACLYGLSILGISLVGLAVLGTANPELIGTVVTLAGAALILGWLIIPVLASGLDMTLEPARFVTFAIPEKSMLVGLALASFIGIPGIITLIVSVGTAVAWWQSPAIALVAVPCGILAALTCILASRAITAASTSLASSRRFKDVSGILLVIPLILMGPIIGTISAGMRNFSEFLPVLGATVAWTPLGAIWAVPADLASGHWGSAGAKFLIALATMAVLAWIWKTSLARALVTPAFAGSLKRTGGKLGFFARFPGTPTGAVAARSLTYWIRDPRYSASLVIAPLLPLIFVFVAGQNGDLATMGNVVGFAASFAAFMVAWSISSDISYDNTAFALHLATGVSGRADRTGRVIAAGLLALSLGVVYASVGAALADNWSSWPAMIGLVLVAAGAGLGLASVFSSRFTMNVPLPGESPLKSKPGNNFFSALIQLAGFAGAAILTVPVVALVVIGAVVNQPVFSWLALAGGIVLGCAYLLLGIRLGAAQYERRAPELLQAVSADR